MSPRWRQAARDVGAALAWGVAAWVLTSVRIELPGPVAFHTDLAEVAVLGSAMFLRRPWLTLIVCAIQALHVVEPSTVSLSFQTTFVMHAAGVPCAWYAHRALQRWAPRHLVLGLAWCGFVVVYYFVVLMPLLVITADLFLPPEIEPPIAAGQLLTSYWRVATAVPYEMLLTASLTALTFVTKEELRRRRLVQLALRDALEAQRALVMAAPVAVVTVRADGQVASWNPAAERLFETPAERAVGAPAPRLEAQVADGEPLLTRVLKGAALFGVEAEIDVAGRAVPVSVFGAPLGADGAHDGAVLIIEDLREQLALRAEVQRGATLSALGELVGGLAHELRNPLFGISAALDAFGPHLVGNARLELMGKTLRSQVGQLNALVVDLLDYGKSGLGDERTSSGVDVPLRHAISDCAAQAAAVGTTLELVVAPGLPPVHIDTPRLVQAFRNLIQNAIAFSPAGAVVHIEASHDDGVCVEVSDRGSGFSDEVLARIFEPFFSRRSGGTGLGLSIVRRIVENHGGTVVAANRQGGGARFIVRLPTRAPPG